MNLGWLGTLRFLTRHPLTADRPVAALVRYVRWQLGSRLLGAPVVVDFVDDSRLLVRRGMTGATGNVYAGLDEYDDMAFVLHALRAGDLFVDVGSNVGTYTVLAAKAVGARVIAFEPIPATAAALRDNIALNAIESRVSVRGSCVGAAVGTAHMTTDRDTMNRVVTGPGPITTISVPVETLDIALAGVEPFLIKIDVEGYEFEVLRGAARVLAEPTLQCVILEIGPPDAAHPAPQTEVEAIMRGHGFDACAYVPGLRRLEPARDRVARRNTLFVRDRALVASRLTAAPKFRVLQQSV